MPGPIVEVITRFLKYLPFEDCGFTFTIVSTIVSKFSNNLSSSKEIFPIGTCKFDDLSTRYSTLRSEERRVGKECRSYWCAGHDSKQFYISSDDIRISIIFMMF